MRLGNTSTVPHSMSALDADGLSVTYASDRTGAPDLRLIHYNDVYHVEYGFSCPSHTELELC